MSCFVVSKLDIDAIITAAMPLRPDVAANPDLVGKMLWLENIRSVAHYYAMPTRKPDDLAMYAAKAVQYEFTPLPLEPIQARKIVDCYDYQTCEHDAYETSAARALIAELEKALPVDNGPAYDCAKWGL
jgi:hypothetical protein